MRVAVIGAGIAGITSAYYLAKKGIEVTVFDRHPEVASESSFANGGQIALCNSETWHHFNTIKRGVKWLFQKEAPLYLNPSLDKEKARWLAQFIGHVLTDGYPKYTREAIALALHSRALYQTIFESESLTCELRTAGMVHLYRKSHLLKRAAESCKRFSDTGWNRSVVDLNELANIDPNICLKGVVGGTYIESDLCADSLLFCQELQSRLVQHYGVVFHLGHPVESITQQNRLTVSTAEITKPFDQIVIAAGAYTDVLLGHLKVKPLSIYPVKGYSVSVDVSECKARLPQVGILDDEFKIVGTRLEDTLRVAGTAEFAGRNHAIPQHRVEPLLRWMQQMYPNLSFKRYTSWSCLRPMTPSMLPIADRVAPNIYVNSGAGHLGWTIGAALSERISNIITA